MEKTFINGKMVDGKVDILSFMMMMARLLTGMCTAELTKKQKKS